MADEREPLPRFSDQDDHLKHQDDQIKQRLEAIYESVKRTRSALLLCILASGTMFICLWNTYASWDRDFAFLSGDDFQGTPAVLEGNRDKAKQALKKIRPNLEAGKPFTEHEMKEACNDASQPCASGEEILQAIEKGASLYSPDGIKLEHRVLRENAWELHAKALPTELHNHQMRSWIDTQVVSVALLGIKISVSDFAILGSSALFLCLFYLLLCERRENHEIGYLFQDICSKENIFRIHGYHTLAVVSSYMVFNLSGSHSGGGTDVVINSLELPNPQPRRRIFAIRWISALIDFLPSAIILATIVCDCGWTFHWRLLHDHFFVSPFRLQDTAPSLSAVDGYFYVADGIAIVALVVLTVMSIRIRSYENGIRDLLDRMYEKLQSAGLEPRWAPEAEREKPPTEKPPGEKPPAARVAAAKQ